MSARKIVSHSSHADSAEPLQLSLCSSAVRVRKCGIEFHLENPITVWTEMSVDLQYPDSKKVHFTGVVVACNGTPQSGYAVSLLFTKLSRQSQALLNSFA